jgi:ubiquinone biosynthesis protein COQ4
MGRLYPSHVPLTPPTRIVLSLGTALGAFLYPQRADLVAAVGELTGRSALNNMYNRMMESREGQRILVNKPIISVRYCDCYLQ